MGRGDELRNLMRNVPAAVGVVTVDVDGERLGLTVASFVSLSLEPPLIGVSVGRHAALHELLRRAEEFGVNLLSGEQEHLAQHFARGVPPIGLWEGVDVRPGPGPPLLADALGWLRCRRVVEHETGDHTLFTGEATQVEAGRAETALVYVRQRYRSVAA